VKRLRSRGLAFKLVGTSVLVTLLVCLVLSFIASAQLGSALEAAFQTRGEAVALSLAAAAEQSVGGNTASLQSSIDSNKSIEGIRYIFILDADKSVLVHTFSPQFPAGLEALNPLEMGEATAQQRVKVNRNVFFATPSGPIEAIDVAAPVSGGALGVVHVGLDRRQIHAALGDLRRTMMLWSLVVALIGIALATLVTISVVLRPVKELTRATLDIVRTGDLKQRIVVHAEDELGTLARSFDQMVEKLREALTSLKESSSGLSQSMTELGLVTSEQTRTITRQASALQETQVTAQEIKQTSMLASQKATAVLEQSEKAEVVSRTGEEAIVRSLAGLADIRGHVEQIASRIQELSDRTNQIGGITETVKDLADQSNMLALNAAIEAVRSGEHGKGFAVVAREIRSLADQSIAATRRVREVLDSITSSIRGVVAITQEGAQRIEGGLEQIRSSGVSLQELSTIVRDSSSSVRQIAAAVSQQNAGIGQIFSAVTDLSLMMDETMHRLDATHEAAARLEEISGKAAVVVAAYRV
jgi:methyl-accepting chemotaxis protein